MSKFENQVNTRASGNKVGEHGNNASRRVMEKCGMTYDHFSEKELTYLDVPRDLTYYRIQRGTI